MNCKSCGGSTTASVKVIRGRTTTVYECNQDNGQCLNAKGYPTSMFASGNGANRAPAVAPPPRFPANAGATTVHFTSPLNRDADIKWQVCLKAAAQVLSGTPNIGAKDVIACATELFLAPVPKPPVLKPQTPTPTPKPVEPETEPEPEQVY